MVGTPRSCSGIQLGVSLLAIVLLELCRVSRLGVLSVAYLCFPHFSVLFSLILSHFNLYLPPSPFPFLSISPFPFISYSLPYSLSYSLSYFLSLFPTLPPSLFPYNEQDNNNNYYIGKLDADNGFLIKGFEELDDNDYLDRGEDGSQLKTSMDHTPPIPHNHEAETVEEHLAVLLACTRDPNLPRKPQLVNPT